MKFNQASLFLLHVIWTMDNVSAHIRGGDMFHSDDASNQKKYSAVIMGRKMDMVGEAKGRIKNIPVMDIPVKNGKKEIHTSNKKIQDEMHIRMKKSRQVDDKTVDEKKILHPSFLSSSLPSVGRNNATARAIMSSTVVASILKVPSVIPTTMPPEATSKVSILDIGITTTSTPIQTIIRSTGLWPSPTESPEPSPSPSNLTRKSASNIPTESPKPSPSPSNVPTTIPSMMFLASSLPSGQPSGSTFPSNIPSVEPSNIPSEIPSAEPSYFMPSYEEEEEEEEFEEEEADRTFIKITYTSRD
jgi:hypothetical protein